MRILTRWALAGLVLAVAIGCSPSIAPSPFSSVGLVKVSGDVVAGPVCPVVRPGDPACDPRPVVGATIIVKRASNGDEVTRAISSVDGSFTVAVAPGDYDLVPQPVPGLLGTAPPQRIQAGLDGAVALTGLELEYDTGIR